MKVVDVHDGDTFFIDLPDLPDVLGKRLGIRLKGLNTPEMNASRDCEKRDARKAQKALADLMAFKQVDLNFCTRDKFYRLDCFPRIDNKVDAVQFMLSKDLGDIYNGGTKVKWRCR